MKVALFAQDSKMPNIAIMKLSSWHKSQGDQVVLNPSSPRGFDRTYVSIILTSSRKSARDIAAVFPNTQIGGTGWSINTTLPDAVEKMAPDFQLYTPQDLYPLMRGAKSREAKMAAAEGLVRAGIGFSARGCINSNSSLCSSFCCVPAKEGAIRQVASIRDLLNPVSGSKDLFLLDNSFISDPLFVEKVEEMNELGLTVDIQSGIDLRRLTEDKAQALASLRHRSGLRMAWDQIEQENLILQGINTLKKFYKRDKTCYMLIGHGSTEAEDMMRVRKLHENGVRPYVMLKRSLDKEMEELTFERTRLEKFKRFVNGHLYKKIPFSEYLPWIKAQAVFSNQRGFSF